MADYYSGLRLGEWGDGTYFDFFLPREIYQWPVYLLGLPGTGKSTLLANLALRLHAVGEGVLVIDHKDGKLAQEIVQRTDPDRLHYVAPGTCYFDDHPHHWGLNILEVKQRDRQGFSEVASHALSVFELMERADCRIMQQMQLNLDQAIRLSLYLSHPTILDVRRILTEQPFRKQIVSDPRIPDELKEHWVRFDDNKQNTAYSRNAAVNSSIPRLKAILTDPQLYYMVTQPHSTIQLAEWLDAGDMVVIDTATGMSGSNAKLLADLILALFMNETFSRRVSDTSRVWRLVADEFDQLAASNLTRLVDKARSYRVVPIMAHQNLSQLYRKDDPTLFNSITSSPIKLTFRVSHTDAETIKWVKADDLTSLSQFQAYLSLADGPQVCWTLGRLLWSC